MLILDGMERQMVIIPKVYILKKLMKTEIFHSANLTYNFTQVVVFENN